MNINKVSRVKYWGGSGPPGSCAYMVSTHIHIPVPPPPPLPPPPPPPPPGSCAYGLNTRSYTGAPPVPVAMVSTHVHTSYTLLRSAFQVLQEQFQQVRAFCWGRVSSQAVTCLVYIIS